LDLGRENAGGLAAEIDALGADDWLDEELMRIKDSMSATDPTAGASGKESDTQ
jgi:hypothetical protein